MDQNKNLLLEEIKKAEVAKNFDAMLTLCQRGLFENPGDPELMKWMHKAQAEYVNEKLHSQLLVELEKKKDWTGLLAIYEKLLTIFPESDRLHTLLKKVQKRIEEGHKQERKDYFKAAEARIETMILKKQLDEAEQACYEMLALDQNNRDFIHLLAHVQHLQDKEMDKLLNLYFAEAVPALRTQYEAKKEQFIRI